MHFKPLFFFLLQVLRRRRRSITVDVVIVMNGNTDTEGDAFTFDPSLTPTITGISQNVSSVRGSWL